MDNAGWHAGRRAKREDVAYAHVHRLPDGHYMPAETIGPMAESFIGGFQPHEPTSPPLAHHHYHPPPSPVPPPLPPKDKNGSPYPSPLGSPTSPPSANFRKEPSTGTYSSHGPRSAQPSESSAMSETLAGSNIVSTKELTKMTAVERSRILRVARMQPHLQFMCGPLLRFDTIDEHGIWHGAALIITADSGSLYEPFPLLIYEWDPDRSMPTTFSSFGPPKPSSPPNVGLSPSKTRDRSGSSVGRTSNVGNGSSTPTSGSPSWNQLDGVPNFDLGPHPADPHSTVLPTSPSGTSFPVQSSASNGSGSGFASFPFGGPGGYGILNGSGLGANACKESVTGQEIWVYGGPGGTFTFWRFLIRVPLGEREMAVTYSINGGQKMGFHVPGRKENMRLAVHSCNGFSAGVNPDDFRGPGFKSGYDPVWMDLLSKHAEKPFHVLVGGGDQLYCDSLMREPELQDWVRKSKPEDKKSYPLTPEIESTIDRFFFNHYCQHFRSGAFARANSSIPMLNMCDDHDLIDGFGSYPDDLQNAPVFKAVGSRGYFFFLLFQCFTNPAIDGLVDAPGKHVYQSLILGKEGPFIPYPSHSSLSRLGPKEWILMLDCRAERKKDQVCSEEEYDKVFARMRTIPSDVEHLIVQLGIPIAYPRMVFLEQALDSKFNPLVALGRNGTMGLSGFVNKFNAEAELLDDLNDHWTARNHKKERNWLIEKLQGFAKAKKIRVTFISGDVHCAAVGVLKTLKLKNKPEISPEQDHRYMLNVVTSAIVNTPPPAGVITMVSSLASKVHKTLHSTETDENMLPIFATEPNGQSRKQRFIMGRRNWCHVEFDERSGAIMFDIRVEREKGYGATVGYMCQAPAPRWVKES
ncbi:hypothetical protein H1R20_g654, partial [Candolleomyces eurysporus]